MNIHLLLYFISDVDLADVSYSPEDTPINISADIFRSEGG